MLPRTIIIAGGVSAAFVIAAIASLYFSPNDSAGEAKKLALESNDFNTNQIQAALSCYDSLLEISPGADTNLLGKTCKCLITEVEKYAPAVQPALRSLMLISLEASAKSTDPEARTAYITKAYAQSDVITQLEDGQKPILQSGINHVIKSCPLP